jgi:two-component sensor histidine kinase
MLAASLALADDEEMSTPVGKIRSLREAADRLLLERIRLGLKLDLAGIAVVLVGELLVRPGERIAITIFQSVNLVAVAGALRFLRDPARRSFNLVVAFLAYAITIVAIGAVGIAAGDATTPVILMVGLALVTATFIPWSPGWQLLSVLLIIATSVWTVSTVVESPPLFWLQNVGAVVPTLIATVVIAYALERERAADLRAERQRHAREEELRESNVRLGREIEQHRRTEEALRFTLRELDHRVKNTLASVQSVADHTLRTTGTMEEFRAAFAGRIQAMSRIHTALAARRWEGLALRELVELVVGPYRHRPESVSIDCDGASLSSDLVRVLGLTLHELATNAAKYGALSTKEGRVVVRSRIETNHPWRLCISWSEHDGPLVREPVRRSFGTKLIEEALPYESGGRVVLQFPSDGLRCEIELPWDPSQ